MSRYPWFLAPIKNIKKTLKNNKKTIKKIILKEMRQEKSKRNEAGEVLKENKLAKFIIDKRLKVNSFHPVLCLERSERNGYKDERNI